MNLSETKLRELGSWCCCCVRGNEGERVGGGERTMENDMAAT